MVTLTPELSYQIVSLFDIRDWNGMFIQDPAKAVVPYNVIKSTIRDVKKDLGASREYSRWPMALASRTFLDRTALSCGYIADAKDGQEDLYDLLACCSVLSVQSKIQCTLVSGCDAMIDGALVTGYYHRDGDCAVGDALIDAIAMKEDNEGLPRIAVSKNFEVTFERHLARNRTLDGSILDDVLVKDEDGTTFVNYLFARSLIDRFNRKGSRSLDDIGAVDRHRAGILKMIGKDRAAIACDSDLRRRYIWLISYHNRYVERYGIGEPVDGSILYGHK